MITKSNKVTYTDDVVGQMIEMVMDHDYAWYILLSEARNPERMLEVIESEIKPMVAKNRRLARKYATLCMRKASVIKTILESLPENGKQEKRGSKTKSHIIKKR